MKLNSDGEYTVQKRHFRRKEADAEFRIETEQAL